LSLQRPRLLSLVVRPLGGTMRSRLAVVAILFTIIVVAYGHATLPVGLGVPVALVHFAEADLAILVPSLLGGFGGVFALLALTFRLKDFWFTGAAFASLVSLAASACGFIAASQDRRMSLATAIPFGISAGWLGFLLFRERRKMARSNVGIHRGPEG